MDLMDLALRKHVPSCLWVHQRQLEEYVKHMLGLYRGCFYSVHRALQGLFAQYGQLEAISTELRDTATKIVILKKG